MAVHQLPRALILCTIAAVGTAACSKDGPKQIAKAEVASCSADVRVVGAAVELYEATNGRPPTSEQDLVEAGFLRTESSNVDISPDGEVVPQPGSGCETGPTTTVAKTTIPRTAPPTTEIAPPTVAPDECKAEYDRVAIAVLAWVGGGQLLPVSQADLVAAGYLAGESQLFDLAPDGTPVPTAGAGCA